MRLILFLICASHLVFAQPVEKAIKQVEAKNIPEAKNRLGGVKELCLKKYLNYQPKQNEPSHAGAQMRLAQITEKKGNKAEAQKLFAQALKADASLKEAKEGLERVSK
jgi:hypothetical protein